MTFHPVNPRGCPRSIYPVTRRPELAPFERGAHALVQSPPLEAAAAPAPDEPDLSHKWVIATVVPVDFKTARYADYQGSFQTPAGVRVDTLEVYCANCRRPLDDVADLPCEAKKNNDHLIGGDQSVRAKRKPRPVIPEGASLVAGPRIDRRGIDAYTNRSI